MFLKLPYEFRGTLETSSGKELPFEVSFSGLYHAWRNPSVLLLVTFPLNGWFGRPVPGIHAGQALFLACDLVQHMVESRKARLLDADGNPVDLRSMAAGLETMVSRDDPEGSVWFCMSRGKFFPGGFMRAAKRARCRRARQGSCRMVDGWCVWEKA
ncbi:MAG TPA: hypothetical protein DCW68_07275 [Rhodospirillaceae bacterium]|nr:MAG: hypothetical protein A2018_06780 [Alphaproteobacteria bacterium GWF2_58_20]HAU29887.1 hypothetical protein [Rhodospirillaceae bacterium]